MKLYQFLRLLLAGGQSRDEFAILFVRISVGVFFAISGGNKLLVPSRTKSMLETLAGAGIPFPNFMTWFVSSVELIGGCLLAIGLLSSVCCAALMIDMIVAIATVQLKTIPPGRSFLDWIDNFLYLPEMLYVMFLIWLICSGPGRFSIDARIFRTVS